MTRPAEAVAVGDEAVAVSTGRVPVGASGVFDVVGLEDSCVSSPVPMGPRSESRAVAASVRWSPETFCTWVSRAASKASTPSKPPRIAPAIAPIVSVSPPRLAASSSACGEGSRASSAKAMGIACAEATDVPTCSTRHSRDEDAGLATSCMALRVAATTSGSGVHAPRSGREST